MSNELIYNYRNTTVIIKEVNNEFYIMSPNEEKLSWAVSAIDMLEAKMFANVFIDGMLWQKNKTPLFRKR